MNGIRRTLAVALVAGIALMPTQAYASDLLASSIASAAKEAAAAAQARPNAAGNNDENPYFLPGVILLSAGGVVALYGMTHDTGVSCNTTGTNRGSSFSCGTTKSKGTIIAGLGIAGVGGYLLFKGNQQKKSSPEIVAGPHVLGLRQHLRW